MKADAQGAHEAIRPTDVALTPQMASHLNSEQFSLYRMIWERSVASQCRPARLAKSKITLQAATTKWVARGSRVLEEGYLKFWRNIDDDVELPAVQLKETLKLRGIKTEIKETQPPPRYSEAKLIQLMEKLGIGRPSTYASTVGVLRAREYVRLEKQTLVPTPLGLKSDQVLIRALPDLVDVKFTAEMESSLDRIAEGKVNWQHFLCDWNTGYLQTAMAKARQILRVG